MKEQVTQVRSSESMEYLWRTWTALSERAGLNHPFSVLCVTHMRQYAFIHLIFKGKESILYIFSYFLLFYEHTILTFSVRAETLKIKNKNFCAYKSRKPYQKIKCFCDWQLLHEVWKSKQPRNTIQTHQNEFKETSTRKVEVLVGFLPHTGLSIQLLNLTQTLSC